MNHRLRGAAAVATGILVVGGAAYGQGRPEAEARLKDAKGKDAGRVTLVQYAKGVLVRGELSGLPQGWHAIHVHETGRCEPGFDAAGGHFNPTGAKHGFEQQGPHAGDLPNVFVSSDGTARFETITRELSIGGQPGMAGAGGATSGATSGASTSGAADAAAPNALDGDGASIVLHAKPDDYRTDPSGGSGDRIACGVIERK